MPCENRSRDIKTYVANGKKFANEKWINLDVLSIFAHSLFSKEGCRSKFEFTAPETHM